MQIDRIEVFHLTLPLETPQPVWRFAMPGDWRVRDRLETVLVRWTAGRAGGARPVPAMPRWPAANGPAGSSPASAIGWRRPWRARRSTRATIWPSGWPAFGGNRFAKAALDTAWWDLSARLQDRPLHQLLGGCREAVEVGAAFDQMASIDELLAAIGQAVDAGYARVELKFRPGWDVRDASRRAPGISHADAPRRFRRPPGSGARRNALPPGRLRLGHDRAAAGRRTTWSATP